MPSKMKLDEKFSATLQKSSQKGGWTYVVWPNSVILEAFYDHPEVVQATLIRLKRLPSAVQT